VTTADGIIVSTPIFKASISGLLKTFLDVLDDDAVIAKPVILAATAGSSRHALAVDSQIRPLLAYMRALVMPTAVFAAPEDWKSQELVERTRRAAAELAVVVHARVESQITDATGTRYRHEFGGNSARGDGDAGDVDFDSALMRLAAGGSAE
jgi:FMN reductase